MSFNWYDRTLAIPYREWQEPGRIQPTMGWFEMVKRNPAVTGGEGRALQLTADVLKSAVPYIRKPADWVAPLNEGLIEFGISDPAELAVLLAQLGHESAGFNRLEENLNYSAGRLVAVWPNRFPNAEAARPYAMNPVALANKVYGGRMGNFIEGHGWQYRGRGLIMLTGLYNYEKCSFGIGVDLVRYPERLLWPEVAVRAALWYWDTRVGYPTSIVKSTVDINGGLNGIDDRTRRWRVASVALGGMR